MKIRSPTLKIRPAVFERSLQDHDLEIISIPHTSPKQISILRVCIPFTALIETLRVIRLSIQQGTNSPADQIVLTTLIKHCLDDFHITHRNKCVTQYVVTTTTFHTISNKTTYTLIFKATGELNINRSIKTSQQTTTSISADEAKKVCEQLKDELKKSWRSPIQNSTEEDDLSIIDDENHVSMVPASLTKGFKFLFGK